MKAPVSHICSSRERPIQLGAEDARLIDRREFLWRFGGGLGGIAMVHLLGQQGLLADSGAPRPEWNGGLHHRARAKRVVQLFMSGAARDRKSTRLNSSHLGISYAVFCLKK